MILAASSHDEAVSPRILIVGPWAELHGHAGGLDQHLKKAESNQEERIIRHPLIHDQHDIHDPHRSESDIMLKSRGDRAAEVIWRSQPPQPPALPPLPSQRMFVRCPFASCTPRGRSCLSWSRVRGWLLPGPKFLVPHQTPKCHRDFFKANY